MLKLYSIYQSVVASYWIAAVAYISQSASSNTHIGGAIAVYFVQLFVLYPGASIRFRHGGPSVLAMFAISVLVATIIPVAILVSQRIIFRQLTSGMDVLLLGVGLFATHFLSCYAAFQISLATEESTIVSD